MPDLDPQRIVQHSTRMNDDLLSFAKALSDETRQQICHQLCCVWLSVNDLVDSLDGKVKQPTVSHHLKFLEAAGLVRVRQRGRQRFYTLNQQRMTACCGQLINRFAPEYADKIDLQDLG